MVCITRWNDYKAVTMGSSYTRMQSLLQTLTLQPKMKKKNVQVKKPNLITDSNKYVWVVDLADNIVSNYRIRVRGKSGGGQFFLTMLTSAGSMHGSCDRAPTQSTASHFWVSNAKLQ